MLVRRRVVDDVRPIGPKEPVHPVCVPHRPDQGHEVELRVVVAELLLDVICIILINIENNELSGACRRNLPAKLGADGAAAPGHKNRFPVDGFENLFIIYMDLAPAQEVGDVDVAELGHVDLTGGQLGQARDDLQLAARAFRDVQDRFPRGGVG